MTMPTGRGLYIWHIERCERGDVARLVERARRCDIRWIAAKAGDRGRRWKQFGAKLVEELHAAGLVVCGWSYDTPGHAHEQAEVARFVAECGADGFIVDAEIEWERCPDPDGEARRYVEQLAEVRTAHRGFLLADAPWDQPGKHPRFPFTVFGRAVDFRCPQVYWVPRAVACAQTLGLYRGYWWSYEIKPGHPVRPHLPSPSLWGRATPLDLVEFEDLVVHDIGTGWLGWEWSQVPPDIWTWLDTHPWPAKPASGVASAGELRPEV